MSIAGNIGQDGDQTVVIDLVSLLERRAVRHIDGCELAATAIVVREWGLPAVNGEWSSTGRGEASCFVRVSRSSSRAATTSEPRINAAVESWSVAHTPRIQPSSFIDQNLSFGTAPHILSRWTLLHDSLK